MNLRLVWIIIMTMFIYGGCSSMLIKSTPAPAVYQLEYAPVRSSCEHIFKDGVRIWAFTASSPYDSEDMVVVKSSGEVVSSDTFRWVASPGKMVAQALMRDLSEGKMFPQTLMGNDPNTAPLQLTGRIFDFSLREGEGSSVAVLKVEVTLTNSMENRVLFKKNYNLESKPFERNSSARFAYAMSELVRDLSQKLSSDLCNEAGKSS